MDDKVNKTITQDIFLAITLPPTSSLHCKAIFNLIIHLTEKQNLKFYLLSAYNQVKQQ
jgi:hypothetical protein